MFFCRFSSLTMTVPPTSDDNTTLSISEALSLRHKYTTLSASHSQCSSQIAHLNAQNAELAHRLGEVSREGLTRIGELEERLVGAERECRWEHGRREAVERKLQVARKELEQLRTAGSHSSSGGTHSGDNNSGSGDPSARVKELEEQLAEYRGIIDAFQQEEAEMRDRIAADQGWVKKCDFAEAEAQMRSLQAGKYHQFYALPETS
jgi:chromosome segregation ATPase